MAGQIIKRGTRKWLVRIFLGREPDTGKKKYASKMIHGTKKDAQAYLNARLRERDLGRYVELSGLSLNEFWDRWLEEAAKNKLRDRSFVDYGDILTRYAREPLGGLPLKDLTPLKIQALYTDLRDRRQLGTASLRKLHVIVGSSLDQAIRWGLLVHNPARSVQVPTQEAGPRERRMRVLDQEEAKRFLEVARNAPHGTLFSLALGTGMRPCEYLALQWQDVDWAERTVQVRRSLYRPKGGGWRFEAPKTKRGYRSIALSENLIDELKEHRKIQPPVPEDKPDLMFRSQSGEPLHGTNQLKRDFRRIVREAGLDPKLTLYSLRHSHATLLLAKGFNPKVVAERLGHLGVRLTLEVYSQVLPTMQREAADSLDDLLY